jgi:hypothetical protein
MTKAPTFSFKGKKSHTQNHDTTKDRHSNMRYTFPNYIGGAKNGEPIAAVPQGDKRIRFPVLDELPTFIEDRPVDCLINWHDEEYAIRTLNFGGDIAHLDVWVKTDINDIEAERQLWPMLLQKATVGDSEHRFWPEDD